MSHTIFCLFPPNNNCFIIPSLRLQRLKHLHNIELYNIEFVTEEAKKELNIVKVSLSKSLSAAFLTLAFSAGGRLIFTQGQNSWT